MELENINALNMFNYQVKHTNLKEGVINHQASNNCFRSTI